MAGRPPDAAPYRSAPPVLGPGRSVIPLSHTIVWPRIVSWGPHRQAMSSATSSGAVR